MRHPKRTALGGVVVITAALCLGGLNPADADEPSPHPSRADVQEARAQVAASAEDVGAIKAQLSLATQQLDALRIAAEQATEAYNGARWRLEQTRAAARTARAKAIRSQHKMHSQRRHLGELLSQSYQSGNGVSLIGALLDANGAQSLLDNYSAINGAAQSMQAVYDRFDAITAMAKVFRAEARKAVLARRDAAQQASRLRAAARSAVRQQTSSVAAITQRRGDLVSQLAAAQDISVSLARQRQQALEQIRREQARAAARAQARAAAKAAAVAAESKHSARTRSAGARRGDNVESHAAPAPSAAPPTPAPSPTVAPTPKPQPTPPAPQPPPPSGGASAAVAFAYAQLGEPYVWGAAGPDAWDCSGLTMGAWAAAAVTIPHYTVEQYYATAPVTYSQLRPGDLVFWASDPGDPATIFHVALYIGNDQMIQAARPGTDVEVVSMWYWIPPTSYGRVG